MGELIYGSDHWSLTVDDRVLAHLQVVIIDKLRRNERFPFTFVDSHDRERTVFLAPAVPLEFVYHGNRQPRLNTAWLHRLAELAGSSAGLRLAPEPPEEAAV